MTALLVIALSACGDPFYREVEITYRAEGEERTASWVLKCATHWTGMGAMIARSSAGLGEELPSGAGVLFFPPRHACYPDWHVPFNSYLDYEPEVRARQLYPTILWLDDADRPSLIEGYQFFAHQFSDDARIHVLNVRLLGTAARRASNSAPGVSWVRKPFFGWSDDPEWFFYDVVAVVPYDSWSSVASEFGWTDNFPAGVPLTDNWPSRISGILGLHWRINPIHTSYMLPGANAEPKGNEFNSEAHFWVRPHSREGGTLVVGDGGPEEVVFRAVSEAKVATIEQISYEGEKYDLTATPMGADGTNGWVAIVIPETRDLLIVQRVILARHTVAKRF